MGGVGYALGWGVVRFKNQVNNLPVLLGMFKVDCDLIAAQTSGTLAAILEPSMHLPNKRAMYIPEAPALISPSDS